MAIANYEITRSILGDFEYKIIAIINRAWNEWQNNPIKGKILFKRTMSNIIFDSIARIAQEEFGVDKRIRILAKNQTIKFLFLDVVLLRFKKGNSRGIGSNIETQSVMQFIEPEQQLSCLEPINNVEVCYRLNDLGTAIMDVSVVARNRKYPVWKYSLNDAMPAAEILEIMPKSTTKILPPVVKPKNKKEDEAKKQ